MSLYGAIAENVREGKEVIAAELALDGANPTVITTPFKTIKSVSLTLKGAVAPGLGVSVLTYNVVANVVNVYAWEPTSVSNPTLVASTDTDTFAYVIVGTR